VSGVTYLRKVLAHYTLPKAALLRRAAAFATVRKTMVKWAGKQLAVVRPSGSFAKGTAVVGGSDVDMLVLLRRNTEGTLAELYQSAAQWLRHAGYAAKLQNVSAQVSVNGFRIDVVPARRQQAIGFTASLYRRRAQTWTQTNIRKQIDYVKTSGRRNEIRLLKIWRNLNRLEFTSFALELAVIRSLKGKQRLRLDRNLQQVLEWIAGNIDSARLIDPGNSANDATTDMTSAQLSSIAEAAQEAADSTSWGDFVWT